MSAVSLATLSVSLEAARLACIAAQNNRDFAAINQTNKTWNKIDKAFKKVELIVRLQDKEEERFQRALAEALEKRRKEDESMRSLGIIVSYAQAERIAEEDEEFEPQTREQKNDHIARRLAIAEQVLALPDEEEFHAHTQVCSNCTDIYSHATKEAYNEDTGHCPDCVAFQQWKNFSIV